jgi:2-hydroxychromene-2-carboxylate isomerase
MLIGYYFKDRACWVFNKDMSDEAVARQVLLDAGFDADDLIARTKQDAVKKIVVDNTQQAKDEGMCGAPVFQVFRKGPDGAWKKSGGSVWGQDELAVVEDIIAGWDEDSSQEQATTKVEETSQSAKI